MTAALPRPTAAGARRAPSTDPAMAPDPVERELKLRLRAQDVPFLRARLDARATSRTQAVDSIYLDTPDRRLARARAALRLRALGQGRRRWVQTFKTEDDGAAFSTRGEWETAAPAGRLAPGLLADSPLARLLAQGDADGGAAALKQLAPVFRTRFTRTVWDIVGAGAHVEVVIDEGQIEAGSAREPILEAELELKAGPPDVIWQLALELSRGPAGTRRGVRLALLPYGDSKAARGYRLAAGAASAPLHVRPAPGLDAALGAGAAARALVAQEMVGLLANVDGMRAGSDPEFVHQARVGLRRMRAGLDVLGVAVPAPLERGLALWGQRLGRVRDWDVLCQQLLPRLTDELGTGDTASWARIIAAARRRRDAAAVKLRRQLDTPAFAHLALRLLQWSSTPHAATGRGADKPAGALALKAVRKRLRRVVELGRDFARHSPQRQHRIRVQAKTVRYAIDCLASVLPGRLQGKQRRALVRFQDAAGRAQDAMVALAAVQRLTRSVALRRAAATWAAAQRARSAGKAQGLVARLSV